MNGKFIQPIWHLIKQHLVAVEVDEGSFVNCVCAVDQCPYCRMQSLSPYARKKAKAPEIYTQHRNILISDKRNSVEHSAVAAEAD